MVVVVVNGKNEVQSVKVDPEVIDPDDDRHAARPDRSRDNQAMQRANEMVQQELSQVTGGMPMPGLF